MNARMILNVTTDNLSPEALRELLERTAQFLQEQAMVVRTSGSIQECGKAGERMGRLIVVSPVVVAR